MTDEPLGHDHAEVAESLGGAPRHELVEVLLTLRLLGFASTDAMAAHPCGPTSMASADAAVRRAADLGWTVERSGRPAGWSLSAEGRTAVERLLAEELDGNQMHGEFERWYRSFLRLNQWLLDICTRWQLRVNAEGDQIVNDHRDTAYDALVLAELERLHDQAGGLLTNLAVAVDRFGSYGPRFDHAVERVRQGEVDWFTRPTIDSFHTVWFELHEHLLATLGITRHQERSVNSFVEEDRAE